MGIAFYGIYGVLFNLYLLRLGYGPEFIGSANAVGMLAFALCSLPAGTLGTRWGIRRMMIAGMCLLVTGLISVPLAESTSPSWQPRWILATYVLAHLGAALYYVNSNPFLMRVTGVEERNHVFSVRAAMQPLAGFAGSLAGGILPGLFAKELGILPDHPAGYRYSLFLAALLLSPALPALWATREAHFGPVQERATDGGPAPQGVIVLMALVMLLRWAGEGAGRTFFNMYMDTVLGASPLQIGVLTAAGQLLAVPAALGAPLLVVQLGSGRTISWGMFGAAVSVLPLALIPHWSGAGAGLILMTILSSATAPAVMVFHQRIVSMEWRATMSGAINMALGLGWASIALSGGHLIAVVGYRTLFLIGAGLTAMGGILFQGCFRALRGEPAETDARDGGDKRRESR
jgi:MFS family permease